MVPRHIAIIMDGNGRWAQARGHARFFGHVRGATRIREVVSSAVEMGVGALTLYAFSTENWKRPENERSVLWKLLKRYLKAELPELRKQNVRLRIIGDRAALSSEVLSAIQEAETHLSSCTGLQLTLAISYGARDELRRAAIRFAQDCLRKNVDPEDLNETEFAEYLDTSVLGDLSDVDLVIRTSGERRLSNFLLWQAAYAELVFLDCPWPEFSGQHLREAVATFAHRQRRFGGAEAIVTTQKLFQEVAQ